MPTEDRALGGWRPDWPAAGVGAWMSTRRGGVSQPPFDSLNLGAAVGDAPAAVRANRQRFQAALGYAVPVFLKQVHGTRVLRLSLPDLAEATPPEADAAVCDEPGIACTVQVADCLPVLFAAPEGRAVGAAHAGWRGLAAGVLEATLREVCALGGCAPAELQAEVREAFAGAPPQHFLPASSPDKFLADLPGLARWRLHAAGLQAARVHGGTWCTVEDASRFFSFRRDGATGRLAAAIWRLS
jgi:YfiH family protein